MSVFVVHKPGSRPLNLVPAAQFGHLEFMFEADEQTSLTPSASMQQAKAFLRNHNYGPQDHLCWAGGDPASLVIVAGAMFEQGRVINWLRWERAMRDADGGRGRGGFYIPTELRVR